MSLHSSIVSLLSIAAAVAVAVAGAGCGAPGGAALQEDLRGRVAMSWTVDGAFLVADRCKAERIEYMEVEVASPTAGSLNYTQVRCDLDRFSLDKVPLGKVVLRVGGMGKDSRDRPCLRRYGEVLATAGMAYPEAPTRIELRAISGACR